jgi:hypothetical protein
MSQLPGVANATIDDAKIIKYLLDPSHSTQTAGKAKFFMDHGFSPATWGDLKNAAL